MGGLNPIRLSLLSLGHPSRFSVRSRWILAQQVFTGSRVKANSPKGLRIGSLAWFSPLRNSPGLSALHQATAWLASPRSVPATPLRRRTYHRGAGILTRFPFAQQVLPAGLGPANSHLTNIGEKPWPIRRMGFSPIYAVTRARIFIPTRSTGPHSPASTLAGRPATVLSK